MNYILNDNEKYEKYYNISMNLIKDNKIDPKDIDYTNFDLKIYIENDEYKFLIISADEENKGNIINMSLNACPIFGYHKYELIGKNMNVLIPELFHNIHNKIFNKVTEKTKTEFFECLSKKEVYNPKFREFSGFARNKSKYLIPLDFKIFFVQTEESDLVYIVELLNKNIYNNELYEENEDDKYQLYCVLTNKNLIIQTFTANCVEFLGLNSTIINSNYDITSFIKQFNEEFQTVISNKEFSGLEMSDVKSNDNSFKEVNNNNIIDDSLETKIKYKKKLLKLKYFCPRKLTWIYPNNFKLTDSQPDIGKIQISSLFSPQRKNNDKDTKYKNIQKRILMESKEVHITQKHIGYYFFFKKIKPFSSYRPCIS